MLVGEQQARADREGGAGRLSSPGDHEAKAGDRLPEPSHPQRRRDHAVRHEGVLFVEPRIEVGMAAGLRRDLRRAGRDDVAGDSAIGGELPYRVLATSPMMSV